MTIREASENYAKFQQTLIDVRGPLEGLVKKYADGDLKLDDSGALLEDLAALVKILKRKL
ncbi:MAG: hypothetical protein WC004_04235 [Candidatus Absconditabacterales bacterium]